MKQQLNTLKPVQLTELESEFQNVGNQKYIPNRYLRSQKPKETRNIVDDGTNDVDGIYKKKKKLQITIIKICNLK